MKFKGHGKSKEAQAWMVVVVAAVVRQKDKHIDRRGQT